MKKYKIQRENTSKRLSFRIKIPGVEWDAPHKLGEGGGESHEIYNVAPQIFVNIVFGIIV